MTFRWWMAPVIGVGVVAIANTVLICTAVKVRPQKSEARPYAASAEEDLRTAERAAFRARGWRLDAEMRGEVVQLSLHTGGGPGPLVGIVHLVRPDDAASDRSESWPDPSKPLSCKLPRPGVWSVRVEFRDPAGAIASDSVRVDRP